MNRSGDTAVGLSGADAGMIPAAGGEIGNVDTKLLRTLLDAGYVPVIEPLAFGFTGTDVAVAADDVAQALASAVGAARAIFFNDHGGVIDAKTKLLLDQLTPAEALAIAEDTDAGRRPAHRGPRGGAGRPRRRRRGADLRRPRRPCGDRRVSHRAPSRNASRGYSLHRMNLRTLAASAALLLAAPPLLGARPRSPDCARAGRWSSKPTSRAQPVNVGGKVALYHKGTRSIGSTCSRSASPA